MTITITKKGFTLMELLVSIFISGMVMLSLVAMWKSSSSQTAEAQRQSIIKNENTIFLRKIYSDFVSATEVICPPGHHEGDGVTNMYPNCDSNVFIAMKGAVIDDDGRPQSITNKVCGSDNNSWATEEEESSLNAMSKRCIRPSYTVYIHENNKIYRCIYKDFLDQEGVDYNSVSQITNNALNRCKNDSKKELIMPYVKSFSLQSEGPELLVNYTVYRQISSDVPPISFKFKKYFVRKRGV